jgi:capsular exopolysaccharide synthesis family protein
MNQPSEIYQQNINYKKIFQKFLELKRVFIFLGVISLVLAYFYNKTATVRYSNSTSVLISEQDKSSFAPGTDFLQGMPFLGGKNNIENEMEILRSFSVIKDAIDRMDIKSSIYSYEKTFLAEYLSETDFIKKKELYQVSPIRIVVDQTSDQAVYLPFYIEFIDDNSFQVFTKNVADEVYLFNYIDNNIVDVRPYKYFNFKYNYGQEIKTEYCSFQIFKTEHFDPKFTSNKALFFYFHNTNYLAFEYQASLTVEPVNDAASILNIGMTGTNYYRITDYLNTLTSVLLDRNLEKKNNAAATTVSFIDSQISEFRDSLTTAEANLKSFRSTNQVMDLTFQGQQVFTKLDQLETEKAVLRQQERYYNYLKEYFQRSKDISGLVAPASMNVIDPILTNLVAELITVNSERARHLGDNRSTDNILLKGYDGQINNLKHTISENVENSLSTISGSLREIDYRINKLTGQISSMPKTELQLRGIERKFELNNTIYTFLLQRRSEAQIAKASSMPDYEVVEPARAFTPRVISPKSALNYAIALFLAFLIPTGYILTRDLLNNRLTEVEEIEAYADQPILGKIFRNFRKTNLVVAQRPNSSVSESFRTVRTNFQFFDQSGKKQVVLFTSASSGDGKTFCSINFASVLAMNGHRTVLLEFDLRRPKIHQEFGSSNMIGISSYLIEKAVIEDIILPTEIENLDLISAGPAAPNPAELIASEKTTEFLDTLKEMYDYIIIDSAPVGIVSETFLLMKHSDVNIFVVRLEKTIRDAFKNALKGLRNNGFSKNFNLLINDLNYKKESYKYGYDTKYYMEENKGFLRRLFSKKRA